MEEDDLAMKVIVEICESTAQGDYGDVHCLDLTCSRCGHSVEVYGTEEASAKRGAMMLREECPNSENNFYDVSDWQ